MRHWRRERRMSQLGLAGEAGVTQRHVSFVESGRANPSREMVLALARALDVPLRERNQMLLAAGYAPHYRETGLDADGDGARCEPRSTACSPTTSRTPRSSWTATGTCSQTNDAGASDVRLPARRRAAGTGERRAADVHGAAAARRELRADRRGADPACAPRGGRRDPGPEDRRAARRGAGPAGRARRVADAGLRAAAGARDPAALRARTASTSATSRSSPQSARRRTSRCRRSASSRSSPPTMRRPLSGIRCRRAPAPRRGAP